jgi:hypothetical protein
VNVAQSEITPDEACDDDFDIQPEIQAAFDLADFCACQERSLWEAAACNEQLQKLRKCYQLRARSHAIEFCGELHSKRSGPARRTAESRERLQAAFLMLLRPVVYNPADSPMQKVTIGRASSAAECDVPGYPAMTKCLCASLFQLCTTRLSSKSTFSADELSTLPSLSFAR